MQRSDLMLSTLRRHRLLACLVLAAVAGIGGAAYQGLQSGAAVGPQQVSPQRRAAVEQKLEQKHNSTAARIKEKDTDSEPAAVTPERAVEIAVTAVRAAHGAGNGLPSAAAASTGPQRAAGAAADSGSDDQVRSIEQRDAGGSGVFTVRVGTTEVDVDRVTGGVRGMRAASR
jgi:hypothetical protein